MATESRRNERQPSLRRHSRRRRNTRRASRPCGGWRSRPRFCAHSTRTIPSTRPFRTASSVLPAPLGALPRKRRGARQTPRQERRPCRTLLIVSQRRRGCRPFPLRNDVTQRTRRSGASAAARSTTNRTHDAGVCPTFAAASLTASSSCAVNRIPITRSRVGRSRVEGLLMGGGRSKRGAVTRCHPLSPGTVSTFLSNHRRFCRVTGGPVSVRAERTLCGIAGSLDAGRQGRAARSTGGLDT